MCAVIKITSTTMPVKVLGQHVLYLTGKLQTTSLIFENSSKKSEQQHASNPTTTSKKRCSDEVYLLTHSTGYPKSYMC